MKKISLMIAIVISVVACKKGPNASFAPQQNQSIETQVAEVIKKADKNLFAKIYAQTDNQFRTTTGNTVRYLPGVFYIPGGTGPASGIDNATCLGTNNVCMVIVTSPKTAQAEVSAITGSLNEDYTDESAQLIINTGETPIVKTLSSLQIQTENGLSVHFQ